MVNCGGVGADVAHRDLDVLGARLVGDYFQGLLGDPRVSSKWVPCGGRTRSWNWPASTLGKSRGRDCRQRNDHRARWQAR